MSSPSGESLRLSAREADWSAALRGRLGRPLEIHSALDSAMDRAHSGNHWSQQMPRPIFPTAVSHTLKPVSPGVK